CLLHAHLEVIPRHDLVGRPLPTRVESGVARPFAERPSPVAFEGGGELQEVPYPTVAAGQERLQPRLAGILVHYAHLEATRPALDHLELGLEISRLVESCPLEGGPRLGHEGGDGKSELAERMAVRTEHAEPSEHAAREIDDGLHILHGLRGLADHEVALEVGYAVLPQEIARREDLLVGDDLAHHAAQALRARFGGHGQGAVAAPLQGGDEVLGDAVPAQRGDRNLDAVLLEDLHQLADPRVVGDPGPAETHPLPLPADGGHGLAQRLQAAVAHGTVDLAFEAEAAASPAALAHLE